MTEPEAAGMHFARRLGQVEPFDDSISDWASYEERLTSFLIVNHVPDSNKVHAFLSINGPKTYGLFKSQTAPVLLSTKSFEVLKKVLSDHLSPKPSVIGERAKYHRRCQKEGGSLSEFVIELRKLSQTCEFGSALDESLWDRFVCGLLGEDIQRVLFTEDSKLTFHTAVERALAIETAKKSATEARGGDCAVGDVHRVQAKSQKTSERCFRCGSPKHRSEACPRVDATCINCDKKGHIQRAYRRGCKSSSKKKPAKRNVKMLTVVLRKASTLSLNGLSTVKLDPVAVQMTIEGVLVDIELDKGAAVSLM
ncbi:uncharacterized protein LOC142775232 [Rhipicephalus microplus]|uniref:uncharacterized protein LOC142775232 n=1 Tax=Rhipicephalus microplus TaxID=6941 RepID=UPI003F6C224D